MQYVSIIITNYNYGEFLAGAIESALAQICDNIEVIVVDDGSTDDSHSVIQSFGSRIVPVFKSHGGQASGFNAGFRVAKGNIICLLDSDDRFHPDKVACLLRVYKQYPMAQWCFHPLTVVNGAAAQALEEHDSAHEETARIVDLRPCLRKGHLSLALPATSGLSFRRDLATILLPMPEEQSVVISDHYLKLAAVALAPGCWMQRCLAVQLLHGRNQYTGTGNLLLKAKITAHAAYWLHRNRLAPLRFTNNLAAATLAIGFYKKLDPDIQHVIADYLASVPIAGRCYVRGRALIKGFMFLVQRHLNMNCSGFAGGSDS